MKIGCKQNKGYSSIGINNNSLPRLIFHRNLFPQRIKRAFTRSERFERVSRRILIPGSSFTEPRSQSSTTWVESRALYHGRRRINRADPRSPHSSYHAQTYRLPSCLSCNEARDLNFQSFNYPVHYFTFLTVKVAIFVIVIGWFEE